MLNFRTTTILFVLIIAALTVVHTFILFPFYIFILIIFLYSFVIFLGSTYIAWNFYLKSLCSANTTEKKIAITFDDAPNCDFTPPLLEFLAKNNIQTTFFCIGKNIENNKNLILDIDAAGHIIGNHSYSHHFWFDLYSSKKIKNEIEETNSIIFKLINKTPKLFRPPYGVTNPNFKKAIEQTGMTSIGWSLRTFDTKNISAETILIKIKKHLKPGDIILFHDSHKNILPLLNELIVYLKNINYQVVGLEELLKINAYE